MFPSGGKRRHDPLRVPPSNSPRNRSRIVPNAFKHGWIIAAVLSAATVVAARETEGLGAAAAPETGPAPYGDEGSVIWQGARKTGLSADENDWNTRLSADEEGDGRRLEGLEPTDQCEMSSLWGTKVDPANYEFGCKEIEVRNIRVVIRRVYTFHSQRTCRIV